MAARVSSQKNSWAGASAKVQTIFKKRKAFYNSPSAQTEIPLTTYKAVGIHAPTHQFKRKIDCGLGSRSDSVAVKAIPGQARADHSQREEMSSSTAPTTLCSILQSQ